MSRDFLKSSDIAEILRRKSEKGTEGIRKEERTKPLPLPDVYSCCSVC